MADTTTWITVADTAVKVGLGALIGGGISIIAAYLSQRRESAKQYNDKKREQLLDVAVQFDKFYAVLGVYWANVRNAAYKKENAAKLPPKERLSKKELAVLKEQENIVFDSFPILSQCNTKLLLLGDKKSSEKISEFGQLASQLFKESHIANEKTTQKNLDNYRRKLEARKHDFLSRLHGRYKSDQ